MDNSKYGKYIVTELKKNVSSVSWKYPINQIRPGEGGRLLWLDNEVIPGAFYVDTGWSFPRKIDESVEALSTSHKHDYDEVLGLAGTNFDDPYDLGGEVEFWLGDEKHIITRSCIVFIPRGLQHCPMVYKRIDRPFFLFTTGSARMYAVEESYHMTSREMEIIRCVNSGLTNSQIADKLCISKFTVQTHISNMFKKTGAKNRTELGSLIEAEVRAPKNGP